jgi:hypothetical protein
MFQGEALPDVSKTTSVTPNAPKYYTDLMSALSNAGQQQLGLAPSQLVAGFSNLQNQGFGALPNVANSYRPQLTAAEQTASQAAAGITPQGVQQMMNPYTQNVVNEMSRLNQQNVQRNVIPSLKTAFVGSGGLGGQRYANATGQALAENQSNLLSQQTGALSAGYTQALDAALKNSQAKAQAAQLQSNLAGQEQALGLAGTNALLQGGAQQQALEQARINAPLQNAINASALMRGYNVPVGTTENYRGPMAGVYSKSPLEQTLSAASLVGSLFSTVDPKTGQRVSGGVGNDLVNAIGSGLSKGWNYLTGSGSGSGSGSYSNDARGDEYYYEGLNNNNSGYGDYSYTSPTNDYTYSMRWNPRTGQYEYDTVMADYGS